MKDKTVVYRLKCRICGDTFIHPLECGEMCFKCFYQFLKAKMEDPKNAHIYEKNINETIEKNNDESFKIEKLLKDDAYKLSLGINITKKNDKNSNHIDHLDKKIEAVKKLEQMGEI